MAKALRTITLRSCGTPHGPITRLISPEALGERLKPFVFLDFFSANVFPGFGFGMHPHSGIATLTWQPGCDVQYEDTTGQKGMLKAGGLEWMNAGGGAWHQGFLQGSGPAIGFQLWVPMPPGIEDNPSMGQYIPPQQVQSAEIEGGVVRVLLGEFTSGETRIVSPIASHQNMNYWVVELSEGARWHFRPPDSHTVAWVFSFEGESLVQQISTTRELVVLDGEGLIEVAATKGPAKLLIGTAEPHRYDLILGPSSIHTNPESLRRGLTQIDRLGRTLRH